MVSGQYVVKRVTYAFKKVYTTEPTIGPIKNSAPPISVMNTATPDCPQPKSIGETLLWKGHHSAPATPAKEPAITKFINIHFRTLIPRNAARC